MTPDLQRLCQVAEEAFERVFNGDAEITPGGSETIVRAVLAALREPAQDTLAAASVDLLRDVTDPWDCMPAQMDEAFGLPTEGAEVWAPAEERIRPRVRRSFAAMIDAILGEPTPA